jgi:hypothetical protein
MPSFRFLLFDISSRKFLILCLSFKLFYAKVLFFVMLRIFMYQEPLDIKSEPDNLDKARIGYGVFVGAVMVPVLDACLFGGTTAARAVGMGLYGGLCCGLTAWGYVRQKAASAGQDDNSTPALRRPR